jgi:hypothetical protein
MRTGMTARSIAVSGAALLALTACGGGGDEGGDTATEDSGEKQVNIYGTDGNMGSTLGDDFQDSGSLAGMSGTTPLTDLDDDFKNRLLEIDPNLGNTFNYAGESYDAVVLSALAATMAGTNDANVFKAYVNGVTFGGDKCTDFAACLEIINGGGNPDYDGISGPLSFTDAGEPAQASFGLLQFGDDNAIDDGQTEFVIAGDEANAASDEGPAPAPAATGEPLVVGTLLPLTGDLAFLGPPEVAGVKLAIADINAAGGVFGQPVQLVEGDSGDASTDTATQTVDRLLQANVNVIVGAAASGVSLTVIDRVTGAGVMQISPANTSDQFTTYNDNGLYFRTAPPDLLQAQALVDLIQADGNNTVGILARNDPYGTGLADNAEEDLLAAGLSQDDIVKIIYDPTASNFDSEVQQMVDFNPDAIVVIGFEESSKIIQGLNAQGIGPQR